MQCMTYALEINMALWLRLLNEKVQPSSTGREALVRKA